MQTLRVTFNESFFQRCLPPRFATRLCEHRYRSIRAVSSLSATTQNSLNPVGVQEPRSRKEQKKSFPKLLLPMEGVDALHTHSLWIEGKSSEESRLRKERDMALTEQESPAC